jgi:hypothetical protein
VRVKVEEEGKKKQKQKLKKDERKKYFLIIIYKWPFQKKLVKLAAFVAKLAHAKEEVCARVYPSNVLEKNTRLLQKNPNVLENADVLVIKHLGVNPRVVANVLFAVRKRILVTAKENK